MGLPAELFGGRGAARWRKVSDAVAGFLRADGKLAPIYAIPKRLGSVHYLSDFTDIVIRQHHRTPSKTLAALSAVDPQLLGELISPALLHSVYVKGKPDIVLNLYP